MASIVASDIMRIKHNTLETTATSVPRLMELEVIQLQDQMRKVWNNLWPVANNWYPIFDKMGGGVG